MGTGTVGGAGKSLGTGGYLLRKIDFAFTPLDLIDPSFALRDIARASVASVHGEWCSIGSRTGEPKPRNLNAERMKAVSRFRTDLASGKPLGVALHTREGKRLFLFLWRTFGSHSEWL